MPRIQMQTVRSAHPEPVAAAEELVSQLSGPTPKLVTLFASRERDQQALNRALRERLPKGTRLVGATTAGELDNQGIHSGSVVMGALSGGFEVGVGVGVGLSRDALTAGSQAMSRACHELGVNPEDLDPRRHVGIVMDDGFRHKKEELLLGLLERNQGLMLVGGGASDHERDATKQSALLHVDGEVFADAAWVVLLHLPAPWAVMRSHWYVPGGERLRITRVDETHTRALEIDGQPAARRYAELLGVSVEELELGKPRGFSLRPTAVKVGREYFLRSPWKPLEDGSILFANLLTEDTELELMRLGDMVESTRRFFTEEIPRRVLNPQAALLFHCGARMWMAQSMGVASELAQTLRYAPPAVGANVQFEIYSGFNLNMTLTALVLGAAP
ncbi:FIST C-terminal domain-containing protein [Pyxidicoccus parkwayensis]|uniref:FIST C-terminal domain-containing protein n=1 Tax=Pyxidicoccus parkwayensis TaxID=2813578 RepID=A0ABX7NPR8_9BACT|nr:FIST N-terminal domain-containing protein [Pyxidicoccus parkwaysis]QSQ19522.1 FIST C-terminal domain-containing protein [Pyxidicoccus parkwaysis]